MAHPLPQLRRREALVSAQVISLDRVRKQRALASALEVAMQDLVGKLPTPELFESMLETLAATMLAREPLDEPDPSKRFSLAQCREICRGLWGKDHRCRWRGLHGCPLPETAQTPYSRCNRGM